jgi:putative ABC transport system substrate-binding protein
LLKELVPWLAHVAVLYNPGDRNKESEYKQSQDAASSLKLTLHAYEARSLNEIDRAFARMADDHVQALVIFADVLTVAYEKRLADLALENRLPAIFGFREFADRGDSSPTVRALRE